MLALQKAAWAEVRLLGALWQSVPRTLKILTSIDKEVRPFFLSNNSIWSYPSVFP